MSTIIHPEPSYKIMGACFEVPQENGCGFLEAVFQETLELELSDQAIPFVAQPSLNLEYQGRQLTETHAPDFACYDRIIPGMKAVTALIDEHRAQVHHDLRATGHRWGLRADFGHFPKVQTERIAL